MASDSTSRHSTADTDGLTVADVMHAGVASMPPTATVGDVRDWFAVSASRRLAVIADGGRYMAALTPADVGEAAGVPSDGPAVEAARVRPTISPALPAATGRDLIVATDARRIPVVDEEGHFHGVLAVTSDLRFFECRPGPGARTG